MKISADENLSRMHEAAKIKVANPKISNKALLLAVGYAESSADRNSAAFLRTKQFDYWVQVYSGLEHIKNISGLANIVALSPAFKLTVEELGKRLNDPKHLAKINTKELAAIATRIAELTAKATATMSNETKQAVTDLVEAQDSFKKYLPDDFKLKESIN
jgi:hypothetical protein